MPPGIPILAVPCKGGYLRITDPKKMEQYEQFNRAVDAVRTAGHQAVKHFSGIMGLAFAPAAKLPEVDSFRKFHRFFCALTGQSTLSYWRHGRRITSSEFEFKGCKVSYDGRRRAAEIRPPETIVMDFMPGPMPQAVAEPV